MKNVDTIIVRIEHVKFQITDYSLPNLGFKVRVSTKLKRYHMHIWLGPCPMVQMVVSPVKLA